MRTGYHTAKRGAPRSRPEDPFEPQAPLTSRHDQAGVELFTETETLLLQPVLPVTGRRHALSKLFYASPARPAAGDRRACSARAKPHSVPSWRTEGRVTQVPWAPRTRRTTPELVPFASCTASITRRASPKPSVASNVLVVDMPLLLDKREFGPRCGGLLAPVRREV